MEGKVAVVVYLDFTEFQFKMFKTFLRSIELTAPENLDVVVFYNPAYDVFRSREQQLTEKTNIYFIPQVSLDEYPFFSNYAYINSIACMIGQDWLLEYKYLLKTDVDTLFTPKWNNIKLNGFVCGGGGYIDSEATGKKIRETADYFRLAIRENYLSNIGSTWLGPSADVLKVAELSTYLTGHILNFKFRNEEGAWPGYYKGVSSMYASEIAINHLVEHCVIDELNFDFPSDSAEPVNTHAHLHCWHTDEKFSKFEFTKGKYEGIKIENLDISRIDDYCLYCALTGNE
ncbi:DUF7164 domain-containing protein [Chitinophaga sp.]|uniref:DUF7164 domain-containing protein n=1 Tax=Chitinophaga sp. TaxID=1869181 RepID=UPI002F92F73D